MKQLLTTFFLVIFIIAGVKAQMPLQEVYYDINIPPNPNPLPAGTQFVDAWGYPFKDVSSNTSSILPAGVAGSKGVYTCGPYFTIVFEDELANNVWELVLDLMTKRLYHYLQHILYII